MPSSSRPARPSRLATVASALFTPVWLFLLHPLWRARAPKDAPWVIGGHRGRACQDNAGEVFAEARRQGRPVVWIGGPEVVAKIRAEGGEAHLKHSMAARRAISQAPAAIYSHGEDDLDWALILLRGRTRLRVYVSHSLSLGKRGELEDVKVQQARGLRRLLLRWLITDFDAILYASEQEGANLAKAFAHRKAQFVSGGGAHLEGWRKGLQESPENSIYWFPTFRDEPEDALKLQAMVREVATSERLRAFLTAEGLTLKIGTHINSQSAGGFTATPPVVLSPLSRLVEEARRARVLISDYSSVFLDYLLLDRPIILFVFDKARYLARRRMWQPIEGYDFALQVESADALIEALTAGTYDTPSLAAARQSARGRLLPGGDEGFARASVERIASLVEQRA